MLVGVLSKNYPNAQEAVIAMKEYGAVIEDAVSIGLGAGDNRQAAVVAEIVKVTQARISIRCSRQLVLHVPIWMAKKAGLTALCLLRVKWAT